MTVELDIHLTDLDTGKVNRLTHWSSYTIIDDLFNPAQTFEATIAAVNPQRQFTAHGGQKAQVYSYGNLQCTCLTDERSEATSGSNTDLKITGRGVGGLLLDSCVDSKYLRLTNKTLFRVVQDITARWQSDFITSVVTNAAGNRYMVAGQYPSYVNRFVKKMIDVKDSSGRVIGVQEVTVPTQIKQSGTIKPFGKRSPEYRGIEEDSLKETKIKPEEKVWEVILKLCKQIACHPFIGADGTLYLTRPGYDVDSKVYGDGIVQKWNAKEFRATGGNVISSEFSTSIASRHSEIIAWATGKPNKTSMGKQLLKHVWSVKDPSPAFWKRTPTALGANKLYKPTRKVFKNIRNEKLIKRACRGMFEEACYKAFSLSYRIAGHTINGVMPVIDTMINVHDERYNLIGNPYYITRVERKMDATGRFTVLHLIPPEIWLHFDHDKTDDVTYERHMMQRVFW